MAFKSGVLKGGQGFSAMEIRRKVQEQLDSKAAQSC